MRIGIVCYPSVGGSGLVATTLGRYLARRGHEVHFISYSVPFKLRRFDPHCFFHKVEPVRYPLFEHSLYTFALTAKIIEVVEEHRLELVHAHYSLPHSLCAHLAREVSGLDFRIVTTLHGTDVTVVGQDKPMFPINRYGIEQSDHVTTVSNYQRDHALRHFNIAKTIEVIHNFIDPNVFRPRQPDREGFATPDDRVVMHISNFRPPKNPEAVIRAFGKALRTVPQALLALVGDGPEMATIRAIARDLGICSRIRHLGNVDSVETVLPYAHCVFQPSRREAFGMVLLEAMASGIPTVSSDVDGIPEVVVHGQTGYTAAVDDHDAMGEALAALCADANLRQRLGRAGRERAVACFHVDRIVPRYEACYQRTLAAGAGSEQ